MSPSSPGGIDRAADHRQGRCSELLCSAEMAVQELKIPLHVLKEEEKVGSRQLITVMVRRGGLSIQTAWVQALDPLLTSCAVLGKLPDLSVLTCTMGIAG